MGTERARFDAKRQPLPNGCVQWTGSRRADGYGLLTVGSTLDGSRRTAYAHRLAYEYAKGPIPKGTVLDHLCRNPSCVNPDHLEAVAESTNLLRGVGEPAKNARKDACANGHLFDAKNTRITKEGWRTCRRCGILKRQRRIERRRAAGVA